MNRFFRVIIVFTAFSVILLGSHTAIAKPDIVPGGPWLTDTQKESLSAISSYEELVKRLKQIEKTSKGLVQLEVIGQSNPGVDGVVRDIYLVKIGDSANVPVMIMTQQHGYEMLTTEAALKLIKMLSTGSEQAMDILDELYVLVIPRVNPDGAALRQRYNDDPDAPARDTSQGFYTASDPGVGWDINRYHWVTGWADSPWADENNIDFNLYPENPVPEAQAVIDAYWDYEPLWMADFHHQGTYVTDDNENVTSSILWPRHPDVDEFYRDLSKQLTVVIYDHMAQFGYSTVTLYPGGTYAGIARNAYGLAGAGSILIELKGGIGQKQNGMLTKHAYEQMVSILRATADGSLYDIDPTRSEEIPPRGDYYYKDLPPHEAEVE